MNELSLDVRAKVNLYLRVVGRRPDGYHDLVTLFDRISLADRLVLRERAQPGITLDVDGPVPAGPDNLAWRAAAAVLDAAGETRRGVELSLSKGVPAGAGLGGGSADCAAALVGTHRLLGLPLSDEKILSIARALGADVPFFAQGLLRKFAWPEPSTRRWMAVGRGVGEFLEEIPSPPDLFYVLINPGFEVSTAWAFQAGKFPPVPPPGASGEPRGVEGSVPKTAADVVRLLRNDLEAVTAARHPEIGALIQNLLAAGALGARMSGSGSTVFGLFATVGEAQRAKDELERRLAGTPSRVFLARGA